MNLSDTMRAMVLTGHDGLDQRVYRKDWPTPVAGTDEVVVRVGACGDNYPQAHSEGTEAGHLFASDLPGLGVEPDYDSLGDPVAPYL